MPTHVPFVAVRPDLPPLEFEIRHATADDAGGIADVWLTRHAGDRVASMTGIAGEIAMAERGEGRMVIVASHGGQVVAYGRARLWSEEDVAEYRNCPDGWWLSGSVVLSEFRRRGIEKALMRRRLGELPAVVHSRVDVDNRVSRAWHASGGFTEVTRDFTAPGTGNAAAPMVLLRSSS